ncbi:hypothetical protein [Streptomyces sp. NBC_00045]
MNDLPDGPLLCVDPLQERPVSRRAMTSIMAQRTLGWEDFSLLP